jgi:hypothetical protein
VIVCQSWDRNYLDDIDEKGKGIMGEPSGESNEQLNALGLPIELCCQDPVTGFFRDGHCHTGPHDHGLHTVCALMTDGVFVQ